MSLKELEAEALKLPENERILLARRLLASASIEEASNEKDPVHDFGSAPVLTNTPDGASNHDRYLYDPAQ